MATANSNEIHQEDFLIAQQLCNELRSGNNKAILDLYNKYHPFFLRFAGLRLHSPDLDNAQTVLGNFWVELLNRKAICNYEGKVSLCNYLLKILRWRIIDNNRKNYRNKAYFRDAVASEQDEADVASDSSLSPEINLIRKERQKIVSEALLKLSLVSPKDAHLVRMYLDDLSYREMAEQELCHKRYNEAELNKKINSIKKQFTREGTGSIDKFRICFERCLKNHRMKYEDVFN